MGHDIGIRTRELEPRHDRACSQIAARDDRFIPRDEGLRGRLLARSAEGAKDRERQRDAHDEVRGQPVRADVQARRSPCTRGIGARIRGADIEHARARSGRTIDGGGDGRQRDILRMRSTGCEQHHDRRPDHGSITVAVKRPSRTVTSIWPSSSSTSFQIGRARLNSSHVK